MTDIRTRKRNCPGCGHPNGNVPAGRFSRDNWDILDCERCGFVYLRTVPFAEELVENLAWEVSSKEEAKRRRREQPILNWIDLSTRWRLRLLPRKEPIDLFLARVKEGPVLDVGCGSGVRFVDLPADLVPFGVEISKALAAQADSRFRPRGGYVVQAPAREALTAFPDGFFSGAFLRSYLEHDADAHDVLKMLWQKMRPGGTAIVKVPNYGSLNRKIFGQKWCGFRWPDHVNYFTKESLMRMAESVGFSVRFPLLKSLPTDDNMVAVLTR